MRSVVQESIEPRFVQIEHRLDVRLDDMHGEIKDVRDGLERVHGRIDQTNARIDQLAAQQGRMVEQVAALQAAVVLATTVGPWRRLGQGPDSTAG